MSIQTPFVTPFVSIRDFGAVPDDSAPAARLANSEAFRKAQATMQSDPMAWGHPLFVPAGSFYLADDLHISKSLVLFGTGMQGESVLRFPAGKSLVVDQGSEFDPASSGSHAEIRDLQIISDEDWTATDATPFNPDDFDPPTFDGTCLRTPGIVMHSTATLQRVYITGFSATGIYIAAHGGHYDANYWRVHDAYVATCGGRGIHIEGQETQGGLCSGTKIVAIGGTGVFDSSFGGNTFVGCYVFEAKGRGYASDSVGQTAFFGCRSETNEPSRLSAGGNVWIGGASSHGYTRDTTAFIAESFANVYPFEVPNLVDPAIKLSVGYPNDGTDPTSLGAWQNDQGEFHLFRWDAGNKVWTVENGALLPESDAAGNFVSLLELSDRQIVTYLTGAGHPRGPWLQGFGKVLLGPADDPILISRGDRPENGTGEPGDIVYDANPGEFIGYVCVGANRAWQPFGKIGGSPM